MMAVLMMMLMMVVIIEIKLKITKCETKKKSKPADNSVPPFGLRNYFLISIPKKKKKINRIVFCFLNKKKNH